MKKLLTIIPFIILLCFVCGCEKQEKAERFMEDGVEVVINHIESYKIKGERSTFTLEEGFVFDTEREDLFEKGLGFVGEFEVDSEGNIYIVGFKNIENFINKFDRKGNFITSFGRRGQGPGELEWPSRPVVNGDKIAVTDGFKKLVIYSKDGRFLNEIRFKTRIFKVEPLKNGKYLIYMPKRKFKTPEYLPYSLSLCNSEFEEIKELDVYKLPAMELQVLVPFFMWRISNGKIYIANEERGYEIWVYDLEGNLIRKIRKEYRPIVATDEFKAKFLGPDYKEILKISKNKFPSYMPPLNYFFTDDEGQLFVMTYEKGENPGEYIYDIFNPNGIFIGRKSLNIPWAGKYFGPKYEKAKNNHLYCYREKESGFSELVVYKMNWE